MGKLRRKDAENHSLQINSTAKNAKPGILLLNLLTSSLGTEYLTLGLQVLSTVSLVDHTLFESQQKPLEK